VLPSRRQFQDGSLQLTTLNESTAWKEIPINTATTPLKLIALPPSTPQLSDASHNNNAVVPFVSPLLMPINSSPPRTPYIPRLVHACITYLLFIFLRCVKKLVDVAEDSKLGSEDVFDVVGAVVYVTEKETTQRNGQQQVSQTVFLIDDTLVRPV
jgi:hypothetical protein